MHFRVLPDQLWREGLAGRQALKEAIRLQGDSVAFSRLEIGNVETPIEDMALVNIVAALTKSAGHLSHMTGTPYPLAINAWHLFKNHDRSAETLKQELRVNQLLKLTHTDGVEDNILSIRLFTAVKPWETVCAVAWRLINLVEWASTLQKKLISSTKFKWDTFDAISARKKYVEAKP